MRHWFGEAADNSCNNLDCIFYGTSKQLYDDVKFTTFPKEKLLKIPKFEFELEKSTIVTNEQLNAKGTANFAILGHSETEEPSPYFSDPSLDPYTRVFRYFITNKENVKKLVVVTDEAELLTTEGNYKDFCICLIHDFLNTQYGTYLTDMHITSICRTKKQTEEVEEHCKEYMFPFISNKLVYRKLIIRFDKDVGVAIEKMKTNKDLLGQALKDFVDSLKIKKIQDKECILKIKAI